MSELLLQVRVVDHSVSRHRVLVPDNRLGTTSTPTITVFTVNTPTPSDKPGNQIVRTLFTGAGSTILSNAVSSLLIALSYIRLC